MPEINPHRVGQHLRGFERALAEYNEQEPFARYLTRFFKENKQMGSSDRRMTSRLCYNWFRLGHALKDMETLKRLCVAEFLCEEKSDLVAIHQPEWNNHIQQDTEAKVAFLASLGIDALVAIFPFTEGLSPAIDQREFALSQLQQPDLFIRVKAKEVDAVKKLLDKHDISFVQETNTCFRLANGSRLNDVKGIAGKYEVQDFSSQRTAEFVQTEETASWWDACAASGGKALMLLDRYPKLNLLVSDIRLSILRNLDERFDQAGIPTLSYRKKVLDLTSDLSEKLGSVKFDGILLDVPCSGSGTWGRTPEMIQQFSTAKIESFAALQKEIAANVVTFLKPGASLIYITCSVYEQENEGVLAYLTAQFGLVVEEVQVLQGYTQKADSMFIARLRKSIPNA